MLFKQVSLKGHIHQFRHSFTTRLLRAGVTLDTVSIMLGHSSVTITQRHYAAWTQERREKIEAAIRKTWSAVRHVYGT
jgi:integrase/recombinase XerD